MVNTGLVNAGARCVRKPDFCALFRFRGRFLRLRNPFKYISNSRLNQHYSQHGQVLEVVCHLHQCLSPPPWHLTLPQGASAILVQNAEAPESTQDGKTQRQQFFNRPAGASSPPQYELQHTVGEFAEGRAQQGCAIDRVLQEHGLSVREGLEAELAVIGADA